ncbi:methionine/alanine import family NSS transporter small subunit [Streptomyces sp. HNM0574]|nr:methionine/alanine import family NSS transporter small subunit [Streptomyces sp. HNM0574]NLU67726.1 methionine/alanine import family NSS transporter small subunit [Streptomyces sp. HNM0574]
MSTGAIVMMIIAITIVWGGLAAAILKIRSHPDEQRAD